MKRLLDLTSRNIDVGQVTQHLFLRYWFFAFSSLTESQRNKNIYQAETIVHIFSSCTQLGTRYTETCYLRYGMAEFSSEN
jgi:hypothetical protein